MMQPPPILPADAFALLIETACEDFEILLNLIDGNLQVTSSPRANDAANPPPQRVILRASPRIQMALAKSFVFNARRANRVCERNKALLPLDRSERKSFLKGTAPLIPVRDVNEHGLDDSNSAKPSMHYNGGGWIDELSLCIGGREAILMGPLNLSEIYPVVDRARQIAGFGARGGNRIAKPVSAIETQYATDTTDRLDLTQRGPSMRFTG